MGYYMRGDYYRGDYYRGDLFSGLKGVFQTVGKVGRAVVSGAVGYATGGPGGLASGAVKGFTSPRTPMFGGPPGPPGIKRFGIPGEDTGPGPGIVPPGGIMRGYHMNKSKLAPSRAHPKGAAPHTVLVRNRHMNVANPRALARASRRAHGFLKLASKFVRYYHPKKRAGRAYIGRRRKSR